jgi:hypothetical protein
MRWPLLRGQLIPHCLAIARRACVVACSSSGARLTITSSGGRLRLASVGAARRVVCIAIARRILQQVFCHGESLGNIADLLRVVLLGAGLVNDADSKGAIIACGDFDGCSHALPQMKTAARMAAALFLQSQEAIFQGRY